LIDQVAMARARNGLFGKAVDERMDVGAVLRKGTHDKRLRTSELSQTALDGAGAPLLAIWPSELMVEALGVLDSIYRHCPRPPFCSLHHSLPALVDEPRTYQHQPLV
jgi:hypothetical protein